MNESSVSSPLLSKLRETLQDAVAFKHADVGMKGLPDASVTWKGLTLWLEFKLHQPAKMGPWVSATEALRYFQEKAPTQAETCKRLARAGFCYYIIWRKKVKEVWIVSPDGCQAFMLRSTAQVAEWTEHFLSGQNPGRMLESQTRKETP